MSLANLRVELSPRARQDIIDILRNTGQMWGREQLLVYSNQLSEALTLLSVRSDIGQASPYLPATHRVLPVGSHVIVYRAQNKVVGVVRVLHRRMNWTAHLQET